MKKFVKPMVSLAVINATRASMGLAPFDALPTVKRPGKTANQNRKQADANRAARAEANRDMKAKRTGKRK